MPSDIQLQSRRDLAGLAFFEEPSVLPQQTLEVLHSKTRAARWLGMLQGSRQQSVRAKLLMPIYALEVALSATVAMKKFLSLAASEKASSVMSSVIFPSIVPIRRNGTSSSVAVMSSTTKSNVSTHIGSA